MEITLKYVGYRYINKKVLDHFILYIEDNNFTGITGEYKTLLREIIDATSLSFNGNIIVGEIPLIKENL